MIVPEEVDVNFLENFKKLILKHLKKGKRFIIVTGGGKVCRKYQAAANKITQVKTVDLDWIGIAATRINAQLLRSVFGNFAASEIINPDRAVHEHAHLRSLRRSRSISKSILPL